MSRAHPNLIEDYFSNIETKQQAYWLGFLYADGNVHKNRISLCSSLKDEHWIDKFCEVLGANKEKKYYYTQKSGRTYVSIVINSKKIANDLAILGCVPCKSKIIEFPNLRNKELDLAFLMGYFDGDGKEYGTELYCGSIKFVEDVKDKFGLEFNIKSLKQKYVCYELRLGAKFFKEMAANYPDSLPRKRKTYLGQKEILDETGNNLRNKPWNRNMTIEAYHKVPHPTKEELQEKIAQKIPFTTLGKHYGVSDNAVRKWCKRYGIEW